MSEGVLKGFIIARYVSNGITGAGFLASIGLLLNIGTYAKDQLVAIVIALLVGAIFLNDISSLPVNIFYHLSLSNDYDLSNKWVQAIAFGSPIVTGLVFILGAFIETILVFLNSGDFVTSAVIYAILFFPQLVQLVPSILYAIYVKDINASV